MKNNEVNPNDLRNIWRLLVGPIIGQLAGFIVGRFIPFDYDPFWSSGIGALLGTLLGFILGVVWHYRHKKEAKRPLMSIVLIGLPCIFMGVVATSQLVGGFSEQSRFNELSSIQVSEIKTITITEEYGEQIYSVIQDNEAIKQFVIAAKDIQTYEPIPNHSPKIVFSCYVDLGDSFPYGLSVDYFANEDNRLIATLAIRDGKKTSYHGTFTSKGLRSWLDNYVPKNELNRG